MNCAVIGVAVMEQLPPASNYVLPLQKGLAKCNVLSTLNDAV